MTVAKEDTGPAEAIDVEAALARIRGQVRPTTFFGPQVLSERLGVRLRLASETFQRTGSFKYRAAMSVATASQAEHLLTASSGNFGAALALAAKRTGKQCTVVMPAQSAQVKLEAVRRHGAQVDLVDPAHVSRLDRLMQLRQTHPEWHAVSAYDDAEVIAGNATLGLEIFESGEYDCVIVPVGGGGLSSGIVVARDRLAPRCQVIGAEPQLANDAARSLRSGVLSRDERESHTICDGARTLVLGQRNFSILRRGLAGIVEVTEDNVVRALQLLFTLGNLKVEPTGALAVAALLEDPARFAGKRVVCVVSGGNVDPQLYARLLQRDLL